MNPSRPLRALAALRDAEWLNPDRAQAWCRILAVLSAVVAIGWLGLSHDGVDRMGKPVGTDFVSFWSASRLVLEGRPAAPYDLQMHSDAQLAALPTTDPRYYAFFYPPTFLLLCLPLALLPYLASLAAWLSLGFAVLLTCLRRLLPHRWALLPVLAFPGVLVNAGHGQNGFVSASCLGGGMVLMQRRPFLAGLCLGVLVVKPHLALAVPVALFAARRWAAVAGAAASALGLVALSWLVLGQDAWLGFLRVAPLARLTLEQGWVEPSKMQSAFAAVRVLHGGLGIAYAAQALAALAVCVLLARLAGRRPGGRAEGALTVTATLACTPFLLDYDLVCLALPIAWVADEAQRTRWLPWEKSVLLAAYVLPLVSRLVATLGLPLAPAVLLSLLLVVARRATLQCGVHQTQAASLGSGECPQDKKPSYVKRLYRRLTNPGVRRPPQTQPSTVRLQVANWAICALATAGFAVLLHITQTSLEP